MVWTANMTLFDLPAACEVRVWRRFFQVTYLQSVICVTASFIKTVLTVLVAITHQRLADALTWGAQESFGLDLGLEVLQVYLLLIITLLIIHYIHRCVNCRIQEPRMCNTTTTTTTTITTTKDNNTSIYVAHFKEQTWPLQCEI